MKLIYKLILGNSVFIKGIFTGSLFYALNNIFENVILLPGDIVTNFLLNVNSLTLWSSFVIIWLFSLISEDLFSSDSDMRNNVVTGLIVFLVGYLF